MRLIRAMNGMALSGVRVIEFAGLAPSPMCGMILSDFGADVIRVDRTQSGSGPDGGIMSRGKRSIAVNTKRPEGQKVIRDMCNGADVLLEPYRKGVMERMDLGPDVLCEFNPRLIYARLTGYGQEGPLSHKAGHDINYISHSGVLSHLGRSGQSPHPPVNLLADFAGGSMVCVLGILTALLERNRSGRGQVIDSNMVEGSAYISSFLWSTAHIKSLWSASRGENVLDGGRAFYDTYSTSDGKHMAVGALEPQFYADLLKGLGLSAEECSQLDEMDKLRGLFTRIFASRTQKEWVDIFEPLDACVTPVLNREEASQHPHTSKSFMTNSYGLPEPIPAPRLSRTPAETKWRPTIERPGQHTTEIMCDLGYTTVAVDKLIREGVIVQTEAGPKL